MKLIKQIVKMVHAKSFKLHGRALADSNVGSIRLYGKRKRKNRRKETVNGKHGGIVSYCDILAGRRSINMGLSKKSTRKGSIFRFKVLVFPSICY